MSPHQIAYSEEHDGICAVERRVTFHDAASEAQPAFTRYRLQWTDANGCRHSARYDVELIDDDANEAPPRQHSERASHYNVRAA